MNFTLIDVWSVLKASCALAPFMFAPGYAAGWVLNLFDFRQRRPLLRLILAVPLSIAICPILSYLMARFAPPALWVFFGGSTAVCLVLLAKEVRNAKRSSFSWQIWAGSAIVVLWVAVAIGSLVDLQIGDKLYVSLAAYDHSTRVAMMSAIARQVPPSNPFFAHPDVPLRYHYLWILLCSLPLKLFQFSARHMTYAGVVWCGLGLMSTVALGLKFLLRDQTAIARKAVIAIGLLCVTGLDVLPTLYIAVSYRYMSEYGGWLPDMDWWNDVPITSWSASMLWVPHHVAALVACFIGYLLLRHAVGSGRRSAIVAVLVAGVAFASAAGMSVYVAFTFVVAISLWLMALVSRKDWIEVSMFTGAGAVAVVLALPYLSSLKAPGGGTAFAEFAVRPFFFGASMQSGLAVSIANALSLPFNYALELGFFLAVGILRLWQVFRRKIPATANELAAWTLVGSSFLVGSFLQSSTITTNDLGIRCFLPAQLILLLWGATVVHDWWFERSATRLAPRVWARATLGLLLVLGIFGTAYQVFMIRMSPVLYDRWGVAGLDWMEPDWKFGKRTYALRAVYEALNAHLPPSAIIQHNPATKTFVPHRLYSGHSEVAGGMDCGSAFGGDPNVCEPRVRRLVALFENRGDMESVCRDYGIDVLVAKDTDPVWRDPSSWVWSHQPLVANDQARALRCGTATVGLNR